MADLKVYDDDALDIFDISFDDVAQEALEQAAPVLETRMKATARSAVMHPGESDMVNSIKASAVKKSKNGAWIVNVGPRGYSNHTFNRGHDSKRTYPVSNALKAIWKEYGIPGRQAAQPFISTAAAQTENQIHDIMQRVFDSKVDK